MPDGDAHGRIGGGGVAEQPASGVPWWAHEGVCVRSGRLCIAGRDAEDLARRMGTPLYAYDVTRINEQIDAVFEAIERTAVRARVRIAMKAQHEPEILRALVRAYPIDSARPLGVDVSSPGELARALECGWAPEQISHTGTNMSARDLDRILPHGTHINVDSISQLRRIGARAPGRSIGLRLNPHVGAAHGMGGESLYCGAKPTKFGIFPERLPEAIALASECELSIVTLHAHVARMILDDDLLYYERVLQSLAEAGRALIAGGCPLQEINVGGGLGIPTRAEEPPLDLGVVAGLWERYLSPLGVVVGCENGEYFSRDSAVLLVEVVSVEERDGVVFVGVDAGWNVFGLRFIYGQQHDLVLCRDVLGTSHRPVTVAGNINQGPDLFAEDYSMPPLHEGDILAILAAGAYAQAASLDTHCLRPHAGSVFFFDRQSDETGTQGPHQREPTIAE